MACSVTIAGRALPCKDALGGIRRVWMTEFVDGLWGAVTGGEIVAATAATTLKSYEMFKNSGSFTQTCNASIENGTIYYSQVVSCVFGKLEKEDIEGFEDLIKGRVFIVVEDVNGNYFMMGHIGGCDVSGGSVETGTAVGDMNGLKYEFTAEEHIAAPFVDKADTIAADPSTTWTLTTA